MMIDLIIGLICGILLLTALAWKINVVRRIGIYSGMAIGLTVGMLFWMLRLNISLLFMIVLQCAAILILAILILAFRFYRDPERETPQLDTALISPADGTVRYIHRVRKGKVPMAVKKGRSMTLNELTRYKDLPEEGWLIGIEMSVLDVHVNRVPIAGRIVDQASHPGPFHSLRLIEAIAENERVTTIIKAGNITLAMVQIASRLVRRIESYVMPDQEVEAGERLGMIRFGSQVDLFIPDLPDLHFEVHEFQHVTAGETVLANWS